MRAAPLAVLTLVALCAACTPAPRGPRPAPGSSTAPSAESLALERHLAALEAQIAKLETDLGKGRGAYRAGSLLRVEGRQGGEPPLDRLRRQDRELAEAQALLATRDTRIAELTRELAAARDQGKTLGEQASDLTYARDALITAQQALDEARNQAESLRGQLATSELQRLKAEREHFRFAAGILKLAPGQTTQLLELQDEARDAARQLDVQAQPRAATEKP